jgi:uncharacterized phage protein (TIGR01671 family)
MRKMKFRVWSNRYSKFADTVNLFKDGSWYYGIEYEGYTLEGIDDKEDVLEQSTGLVDKNKKEIYEGDIVDHYGEIYEIIFEYGCWVSRSLSERIDPNGEEYKIRNDLLYNNIKEKNITFFEIIGNIHENSELLEINNKEKFK